MQEGEGFEGGGRCSGRGIIVHERRCARDRGRGGSPADRPGRRGGTPATAAIRGSVVRKIGRMFIGHALFGLPQATLVVDTVVVDRTDTNRGMTQTACLWWKGSLRKPSCTNGYRVGRKQRIIFRKPIKYSSGSVALFYPQAQTTHIPLQSHTAGPKYPTHVSHSRVPQAHFTNREKGTVILHHHHAYRK